MVGTDPLSPLLVNQVVSQPPLLRNDGRRSRWILPHLVARARFSRPPVPSFFVPSQLGGPPELASTLSLATRPHPRSTSLPSRIEPPTPRNRIPSSSLQQSSYPTSVPTSNTSTHESRPLNSPSILKPPTSTPILSTSFFLRRSQVSSTFEYSSNKETRIQTSFETALESHFTSRQIRTSRRSSSSRKRTTRRQPRSSSLSEVSPESRAWGYRLLQISRGGGDRCLCGAWNSFLVARQRWMGGSWSGWKQDATLLRTSTRSSIPSSSSILLPGSLHFDRSQLMDGTSFER